MLKFLKKNQILVTVLALLIAVAGYLNFADKKVVSSNSKKEEVTKAANDEVKENPGDAVLVSSQTAIAQAKLNRDQVRANNKEALMEIVENANLSDAEKEAAVTSLAQMSDISIKENDCETILETKGFESCVVTISDGSVDVSMPKAELTEMEKAQVEDIVKRKTGVDIRNIVIGLANSENNSLGK